AGVLPEAADAFIAACRGRLGLQIVGLMCIPPSHEEPALHFALLREIAKRNGLDQLSMGMSADFETAIRFGATYVRVGTAIFGARGSGEIGLVGFTAGGRSGSPWSADSARCARSPGTHAAPARQSGCRSAR